MLYRYFSDKNDLTSATLTRFVDTVITPRIYAAIGEEALEFELVQRAIGAYVDIIDEDTEIYTPLSSRIAHLVLIDVLAVGVAKTRGPKLAEQLKAVKKSLTTLRYPEES